MTTVEPICDCHPEDRTGGVHDRTCSEYEPECTCYEFHGGHQPGCPMVSRVPGFFENPPVPTIVTEPPFVNEDGQLCFLCDGTYAHEHHQQRCTLCGAAGLAENMIGHDCEGRP